MIKKRKRKNNQINLNELIKNSKNSKKLEIPKKVENFKKPENIIKANNPQKAENSEILNKPEKREEIFQNKKNQKKNFFGPSKINRHFKNPITVDYNPSICKDFKDSGYCTWGSTCIYAHDRTEYKRGWELDKEWENKMREKGERYLKKMEVIYNRDKINFEKKNGSEIIDKNDFGKKNDFGNKNVFGKKIDFENNQKIDFLNFKDKKKGEFNLEDAEISDFLSDEENHLFKCYFCKKKFDKPTLMSCQHIFCEKCVFEFYRKIKKCQICNLKWSPIFNNGESLVKILRRERKFKKIKKKKLEKKMEFGTIDYYLKKNKNDKFNNFDDYKPNIIEEGKNEKHINFN